VPPATTQALVLHGIAYGDTSRILRLLTRDHGLQSVIAKGARRARSRTGPRLDLFNQGEASIQFKPHRELNTLTAFEMTDPHTALAEDVARFAAASALAELALRFAPVDAHPELYDTVTTVLAALERAPAELVETVGLLACWQVIGALGFAPALDQCAACGREVSGALAFSASQGGALCTTHRREARTSNLAEADAAALRALVAGQVPDPPLGARHEAAHRRLLLQFVRYHLAEQRPLPALAFWDGRSWDAVSS
jgi:DNA repair protein RecO (recombination protein O)